MQKVKTFLVFADKVEEAVKLYTSLIPGSQIGGVHVFPAGDQGNVTIVDFTLAGVEYVAMQTLGFDPPNHTYSFSVSCDDQAEVDRLWSALVEGGEPVMCGWLKDKYGFSWQIVPKRFNELMEMGTPSQKAAVMGAMMQMVKFEIAPLEEAFANN